MPQLLYCLALIVPLASLPINAQVSTQGEDRSRLAVTRSDFAPPSPIKAGVQSQPEFTRELLQVQWRQGDPIDVYIVRPENAVKPPAVVFLYTWPGDAEHFKSDAWCRSITRHGFAAVGFVSALTGQRYHDRPWKETFATQLPEALIKSVHDVQLMLDYLDTREDLDRSRYGIFGQGSGGTIAVLAASVDKRLKFIDVIDPWGDWPAFLKSSPILLNGERGALLTQKSLDALAALEPVTAMRRLRKRSIRLQQTGMNLSTPKGAANRLRRSLPPNAAYTRYTSEEDYRLRAMSNARILDWMERRLVQSVAGNE